MKNLLSGTNRRNGAAIIAAAFLLVGAASSFAGAFTVVNTNPSGAGSLAQAITNANAASGPSTIGFNIPGPDVQIITGALPTLTKPITIDGYTQPGTSVNTSTTSDNASLSIRVSGGNLTIGSGGAGSVIRGLCITGGVNGVKISNPGSGGNCTITGNFIGINPAGNSPLPCSNDGILVESATTVTVIGGQSLADRNVIGGCGKNGIEIAAGGGASSIKGNFIGIEATGTSELKNGGAGVMSGNSSGTTQIVGKNVISGNTGPGISGSNLFVSGNYIGTNAVGTAPAIPNSYGLQVSGLSRIGQPGDPNIISGNTYDGISVSGDGTEIFGNYIGLDVFGQSAVPNGRDGISCDSFFATFTIGGATNAAGNVISGNTANGINLSNGEQVVIKGNIIGFNAAKDVPRGNGKAGIVIGPGSAEFGPVSKTTIGGSQTGAGNTIANNGTEGVLIFGDVFGTSILSNSIYSNGTLGIDLTENIGPTDGVTANDPGDTDGNSGFNSTANGLQNYPVLTFAQSANGTTTVPFTFNSTPSTTFTIEFFSSPAVEGSGYGEGKTFIGSVANLTTDSSGDASFTASLPVNVPAKQVITATATSADGDTSEFSKAVPVNNSALVNISTRLNVLTGDNVLIGGFIVAGTEPKKVIIRAIGSSLKANGTPIAGRLADPTLELHALDGSLIGSNDNWKTTQVGGVITADQVAEIEASGIAPTDDAESAIIATLAPGNYTAIIRGAQNSTGIGLVEVYDLNRGAFSRLANISTRGFVDTGDNVMIGGFIVSVPFEVYVIRAIGPSLEGFANVLADPTLQIFDGSGTVISGNDDWRSSQEAAITATGIAPKNDLEAATIGTLPAGNYTAIVRGKNGGTGLGLVEVYHVQAK